jgi:hypothetical protein
MSLSIGLVRKFSDEVISNIFTEDFIAINRVLQAHSLPPHIEPGETVIEGEILPWTSCSYSQIHDLRYMIAKFIENPTWLPDISRQKNREISQELYARIRQEKRSHFLCHSDVFGYYVPIDFEKFIVDETIRGGLVGSSIRLTKELEELAEKLNFNLGEYTPDFKQLSQQRRDELDNDSLKNQKWLLLCLYNIALASIRYGNAIYFN